MLHTTLVLSIVPSFCLLNRNFPPNNLSALSFCTCRLGLSYLTDAAVLSRGQRTPEVNKVALTALKYFIALISATIISYINAFTLTALVYMFVFVDIQSQSSLISLVSTSD